MRVLMLVVGLVAAGAVGLLAPGEDRHLSNVRQLTFAGENAEAYFSADGKRLIFQSTRDGLKADQIFTMRADGRDVRRVSTGKGRTTCAYFFPNGRRILYASTHAAGDDPPPRPDYSQGYVWPVYSSYDLYTARPDGSDLRRLTATPGYDAEATISPDGRRIVFTSMRDGDLDLYTMDPEGRNVRRLTRTLGYDGGAFFSADGRRIVYRAWHPRTPAEIADYRALLARDLVRPGTLELFVMDADGSNVRQVTHNGAANFCPFFTPDGKRIVFSSNLGDPKSRNFDLYLIGVDGTGLERLTTDPTFDGFPMFSPACRRHYGHNPRARCTCQLVWGSNRNARQPGETNIFIADWRW